MPREVEHSGSVTLISKPFYSKRMGKRVDSEMTTFFSDHIYLERRQFSLAIRSKFMFSCQTTLN